MKSNKPRLDYRPLRPYLVIILSIVVAVLVIRPTAVAFIIVSIINLIFGLFCWMAGKASMRRNREENFLGFGFMIYGAIAAPVGGIGLIIMFLTKDNKNQLISFLQTIIGIIEVIAAAPIFFVVLPYMIFGVVYSIKKTRRR